MAVIPKAKTSDQMPEVCTNISFRIESPAGPVTVFFIESADEKDSGNGPIGMNIYLGKPGTEGRAWAEALSKILTHVLLNKLMTVGEIYQEISGITTDKSVMDRNLYIRSGPAAIGVAILRYNTQRMRDVTFVQGATGDG